MDDRRQTPPLAPEDALDWPARADAGATVAAAVARHVRRRNARRKTLVCGVAGALALVAAVAFLRPVETPVAGPVASAAALVRPAGETLADGSRLERNGDALVRVEFDAGARRVVLLRGEAHFEVAHDAARPFIVVVGEVEVRAVGTAFSVEAAAAAVDVLVTEGRVAVDRAAPDAPTPATLAWLDAGSRVRVTGADLAPAAPPPAVVPFSPEELARRHAWRVPRLQLDDASLDETLALFNEHGATRLVLAETGLGALRVSGVVRADNTSALLHLLLVEHGIEATPRGERELLLARAAR